MRKKIEQMKETGGAGRGVKEDERRRSPPGW